MLGLTNEGDFTVEQNDSSKVDTGFKIELQTYLENTVIPDRKEFAKVDDTCSRGRMILNDSMLFWNSDYAKKHFSRVRQVALRILSITVSTVSSTEPERLFSMLKNIVKSRQSRFSPQLVHEIICLSAWLKMNLIDESVFANNVKPKEMKKMKVRKKVKKKGLIKYNQIFNLHGF